MSVRGQALKRNGRPRKGSVTWAIAHAKVAAVLIPQRDVRMALDMAWGQRRQLLGHVLLPLPLVRLLLLLPAIARHLVRRAAARESLAVACKDGSRVPWPLEDFPSIRDRPTELLKRDQQRVRELKRLSNLSSLLAFAIGGAKARIRMQLLQCCSGAFRRKALPQLDDGQDRAPWNNAAEACCIKHGREALRLNRHKRACGAHPTVGAVVHLDEWRSSGIRDRGMFPEAQPRLLSRDERALLEARGPGRAVMLD